MGCSPTTNVMISPQIVSSATRPTGRDLFEGLEIYELDTHRKLQYDGTGWVIMSEPQQTYAPVFVNTVQGNGTVTGKYTRSNGYCDFTAVFVLGSTSTVTGPVTVNAPVAYSTFLLNPHALALLDSSAGQMYMGLTYQSAAGTTTVNLYYANPGGAGTSISLANIGATVPYVWAVSDQITVSGRFQMNTRYL